MDWFWLLLALGRYGATSYEQANFISKII
jgi:hydroxyproline O-galactosyltransferase 2/3/4/5/6